MSEFASFKDLMTFIEEYEQEHFVQLWKRDARKIEAMKRVCPHKLSNCNPDLQYYSITFACSRGGRKFKTKSAGLRNRFTAKDDCSMHIRIKLSSDGQKLQIASIHEDHNHIIDKNAFFSLPKQRRLNCEEKKEAENFLKLKCNKKLLQKYLQDKTGKPVQIRDISNLKHSKHCSISNLENVLKILDGDNNKVQIAVDENNTLLGVYYQTPWMQSCFAGYPELLILDGMNKLNNLDMPVYMLMSVNGNNEGDPVAIFVVVKETSDIISHMIKVFKEYNPKWCSVKIIVTDKDFGEKSVLCTEFPDASHQDCIFHVLKRFRTAISTQTMNINNSEKKACLELLKKIYFSKTASEYDMLYQRLIDLNYGNVSDYYNKDWHSIKEKWVQCYQNENLTFGVTTTNHLEAFNQQIEQIGDKFISLESFFENFIILLNSVTTQHNQTANSMLKKQYNNFEEGSTKDCYFNFLTPHAFKLVSRSLNNISKYDVSSDNTVYSVISKDNSDEIYEVDVESYKCSCIFNTRNYLPCSHILAVKCKENGNLYDESLIHRRYLKSLYIQSFKSCTSDLSTIFEPQTIIRTENAKKRTLTTEQKYEEAISRCQKIASIISSFDLEEFNASCTELDTLIEHWNKRKKIKVCLLCDLQDKNHTITSNNNKEALDEEVNSDNNVIAEQIDECGEDQIEELLTEDIDT